MGSDENEVDVPDWLQSALENTYPVSPEFAERCREAGLAAWSISCMRRVLENQSFQAMPLVEFVRHLAAGVEGQTRSAEEIANITINHFQLQKKVLNNLAEICRLLKLFNLNTDQITELCLATEPYIDPDGLREMVVRYCPEQLSLGAQDAVDQFRELYYAPPRNPRAVTRQRCMTHAIASMVNAVRMNWKDLPDAYKTEIKQHLYVDDSNPDKVIVSIIGPMEPKESSTK